MKENSASDFLLFADFVKLAKSRKKTLCLGMFLFSLLGCLVAFYFPVKYKAEATFREIAPSYTGEDSSVFGSLLASAGITPHKSEGAALLSSEKILEEVVYRLGLQVEVKTRSLLEKIRGRLTDFLFAEMGHPLVEREKFIFKDVLYKGQEVCEYRLLLLEGDQFELQNSEGIRVACGALGEAVSFDKGTLTLVAWPQDAKLFHPYQLTLSPLYPVVHNLTQAIKVEYLEKSSSLLQLTFTHRDRLFALQMLDEVMASYKRYLMKEDEEISKKQLAYLDKRRVALQGKVGEELKRYVAYLKDNLKKKGFFTMGQELELAMGKQRSYVDHLLELQLEENRLMDEVPLFSSNRDFVSSMLKLQDELTTKKKKRDETALVLARRQRELMGKVEDREEVDFRQKQLRKVQRLSQAHSVDLFFSHLLRNLKRQYTKRDSTMLRGGFPFKPHEGEELNKLREKRKGLRLVLSEVDRSYGQKIEEEWERKIKGYYGYLPLFEKKEDMRAFLAHKCELISLQEEVYQQRKLYPSHEESEFAAVDLKGVEGLYLGYVKERDERQEKIKQLTSAKKELKSSYCEWGSLVELLPDQSSREIAQKMGQLTQSMRQKHHFGERDLKRMERALNQHKEDLRLHIDQTLSLYKVQIELLEKKMTAATKASLDLLNRDIALVERELAKATDRQLDNLGIEKGLIEEQIDQLKEDMADLPDNWLKERQIHFNTQLSLSMLEAIAKLIESKRVEDHLAAAYSKPLGGARAAPHAESPHLKMSLLLGAMVGLLLTWGCLLMVQMRRGFPLTMDNLTLRGYTTFGIFKGGREKGIAHLSERDLEVARQMVFFLSKPHFGGVVSLFLKEKSNEAKLLAELLTKEGKRVMVIDLTRSPAEEVDPSGLFGYLRGQSEQPVITQEEGVDILRWGGKDAFQTEYLKQEIFTSYLESLRAHYNFILITSDASITSTEAQGHLLFSHTVLITLKGYTSGELAPYFEWEASQSENHLGFVKTVE